MRVVKEAEKRSRLTILVDIKRKDNVKQEYFYVIG